nr:hypothetical protein [uncultured Bacteroides sp.]
MKLSIRNKILYLTKYSNFRITANPIVKAILKNFILDFFKDERFKTIEGLLINIIVTRQFEDTFNSLRGSEKEVPHGELDYYKAIVNLPNDSKSNKFNILIREDVFTIDLEYYSTVIHEFTHIIDYTEFFKKYGNLYIQNNDIKISNYYYEFYLWTEFNAKRNGIENLMKIYSILRKEIDLKGTADNFICDLKVEKRELNRHYELMHFLARISVFEKRKELTEDEFPIDFIVENVNSRSRELFEKLKSIKSFDDFDSNKSEIRQLLDLKKQENYYC